MPTIDDIFSSTGLLAKTINGFVPREAQTEMAQAVKEAIDEIQVVSDKLIDLDSD